MKKLIILIFLCSFSYLAQAQLKSNTPKYIVSFKRFAESNPQYFSDTLEFKLPNSSFVMVYYNPDDYDPQQIEEEITASLKRAVKISENEVRNYYLNPNFWESELEFVTRDIYQQYANHKISYTLGIPVGLDFIAGRFAPEMGFRIVADFKKFGLGASITNTSFFTDKVEGGVRVHHNPFLNAEIDLNPFKRASSTIQAGYLLRSSGPVFMGNTFRLAYRYRVKGNLQLNAGFIFTDDAKTIIPTVGIRLF